MIGGKHELQIAGTRRITPGLEIHEHLKPLVYHFPFLSHERPRVFVLLVLLVTPAVYNTCSLAFKTVSVNRSQAAGLCLVSHGCQEERAVLQHTITCRYGFRGEHKEVTFL